MLTRVLTQVYTRVPTKVGFLCVIIPYTGSHSSAHVSAHAGAHASVHEVVWSDVIWSVFTCSAPYPKLQDLRSGESRSSRRLKGLHSEHDTCLKQVSHSFEPQPSARVFLGLISSTDTFPRSSFGSGFVLLSSRARGFLHE